MGATLGELTMKIGLALVATRPAAMKLVAMVQLSYQEHRFPANHHLSGRHRSRWPREQCHPDSGHLQVQTSC
jgi:hypothetical protein